MTAKDEYTTASATREPVVRRPGRPPRGPIPGTTAASRGAARREAILAVATELIAERGYEGASLDVVCERAACSKSAIYALFGSKEGLLATITEDIAVGLSQAILGFHLQHLDVREALLRYARQAQELILSARHVGIIRATIAAVHAHPEVGPRYYAVGALTAQAALRQYFTEQTRAGLLRVPDPARAARQFQGLLFWERAMAQIVGAQAPPSPAEIESHAQATVAAFLAMYGPR